MQVRPPFTWINHVGLRFDTFAADISIFWRRCATLSFIVASTLESVAQTSPQIPARGELAAVPWYVWSLFAAVDSFLYFGARSGIGLGQRAGVEISRPARRIHRGLGRRDDAHLGAV